MSPASIDAPLSSPAPVYRVANHEQNSTPTSAFGPKIQRYVLLPGCSLYGPLDLLGAIENGLTYNQLLDDSVDIRFDGQSLRRLSLPKYVELKKESSRPKDQARLPVLQETLEMLRADGQHLD